MSGRFAPMRRATGRLALAASLLALAACSSTDKPKPAPLESLTPSISGRLVWSKKIGDLPFTLMPAVAAGGRVAVAAGDGGVSMLSADDGRELWRVQVGEPLAAGVGSDGTRMAVVTRGNEVVLAEGGQVRWRQRLPARVTTAPLVAGERVFVMSVDRVVHAFDALDGRRLWRLARPGDALTLAQPGVLAAFRDTLLVGQGPRLAGVDPLRGTVRWEVPVAAPRGTNEVERLADLVGPAVREGSRICVRAFQAAVGCVDAERASLLWNRPVGGLEPVAGDAQVVVGADGSDRLTAWRPATGDVLWSNERFVHRGLSGGLAVGPTVVFGDREGYVHFLSSADGRTLLRLPTDGTAVIGTPVKVDTTVLVATRGGGLFAFRPL